MTPHIVAGVVFLTLLGGAGAVLTDPGPVRPVTLIRRYGWAVNALVVAVLLTALTAIVWPRQVAAAGITALVVGPGIAALLGRNPWLLVRRVALRSRWPSVARACRLANREDVRSDELGSSVVVSLSSDRVEYLPTLSHGRALPADAGVTYRLTTARGGTIGEVANEAEPLAAALRVALVTVHRNPDRPDRGTIDIYWSARP